MHRIPIFHLLAVLVITLLVAGCVAIGPVGSQDFPQMVERAVTKADGKILIYGSGNWHPNQNGFPALDFMHPYPEPYPGILVITNAAVLFLKWDEQKKTYITLKRLPFTELTSVSLASSGLTRRIVLQKKDKSYDSFDFTKAKGFIVDSTKTEETVALLNDQIKPHNISKKPAGAAPSIKAVDKTKTENKQAQNEVPPAAKARYPVPHFDAATHLVAKRDREDWVHYIGFSWKGSLLNNQPHGNGLCGKLFKGQLYDETECVFSHGVRTDEAYRQAKIKAIAADIADHNATARRDAEDEARWAAEDRQRKQEEAAAFTNAMQTFSSTLNSEIQNSNRQQAENQERLERSVAAGNAEYQRRQADEERIKKEMLANERDRLSSAPQSSASGQSQSTVGVKSQSATSTRSTGIDNTEWGRASKLPSREVADQEKSSMRSGPVLTAYPEAVVVCTIPESNTGAFTCDGPMRRHQGSLKSTLGWERSPDALMQSSVGALCGAKGKLSSPTHLVWACGFGATGGTTAKDTGMGISIEGRKTYYCTEREDYCHRTEP
jgi:hypothetical protein